MRLGYWSDIKLGRKGLIVVAAPAAATVLIACAAYFVGSRIETAEKEVNQRVESAATIQELRVEEADASASIRGYLIGGDERLASRIRDSFAVFDATCRKLAGLIAGSPAQQESLRTIEALERQRVEMIFDAIGRLRAGVLSPQEQRKEVFAAQKDRAAMESIFTQMLSEESRTNQQVLSQVHALHLRLSLVIGICAVGGVFGGLVISMLFASGITSRIAKVKENLARLSAGVPLDHDPAGQDEIGMLNEGILRTAAILRTRTSALENALQGIALSNSSGRLTCFNKAFADLVGLSDSAPSTYPLEFLSTGCPEDRARVEEAIEWMSRSERGEVEARICRPDSSITDVSITLLPVAGSEPTGPEQDGHYHIFVRDITLQRQAEQALIQARDAALASSRARTEFLAKISHDIRTPLNAILGSADLLSQTPLDPDQTEYVHMFRRNCRRLVALINDFLDFSRIEAGAVRIERTGFRLRQIVDDVVRTFFESASRKEITLGVSIPPEIPDSLAGDPLRIQQVLTNLLSNALKFTQEGSVDVQAAVVPGPDSTFLRLEITDSGPGIAVGDQKKIFAPFVQVPLGPGTPRGAGSGLGLAICHELVQLMGGEIGVESSPGAGSTFYFTVPLILDTQSATACPASAPRTAGPRHLRPLRVLIAEDEVDNRALFHCYLRGQPLDLHFADNGEQAVSVVTAAAADAAPFDLILMDIDMPVMDGHAAVRRIREWQAASLTPDVPIVALSASAVAEEVRACLDDGCVAHVAKPVDQATLIETIDRYSRRCSAPARIEVPEAVKPLVPAYLESKVRQVEDALVNLTCGNFELIRRFGHNLKGTGRGYGFPEIEELGRRIEKSAAEADRAELACQLRALARAVDAASREGVTPASTPV